MPAKRADNLRMTQGFIGMARSYRAKQVGSLATTWKTRAEGRNR